MSPRALRIHIVTEEDPFYLPVFFGEFLAHVPRQRFDISGLDITPAETFREAGERAVAAAKKGS